MNMKHSAVLRAQKGVGMMALLVAIGLTAGCLHDPRNLSLDASAGGSLGAKNNAALAALALGDLPRAEGAAEEALKASPDDPYGLLVLGTVYERTARPALARETYMQLYNLPIDRPIASSLWRNGEPTTVQAIAASRIIALPKPAATFLPAPTHAELADRGAGGPTGEQTRYAILERLHAANLVTDAEYNDRLSAIKHGSARHLGGPPSYDEISRRFSQLRRTLDAHDMSVEQFTNERVAILDGLVPLYHDTPPMAPASISPTVAPASPPRVMSAPTAIKVLPSVPKQAASNAGPSGPTNPAATLKSGNGTARVISDPMADPVAEPTN